MEHGVFIRLALGVHHLLRNGAALHGQGGENIVRVALGGVVIDPLRLAVVALLLEAGGVQLRVIGNVVGDIRRGVRLRLGSGVILRGAVFTASCAVGAGVSAASGAAEPQPQSSASAAAAARSF